VDVVQVLERAAGQALVQQQQQQQQITNQAQRMRKMSHTSAMMKQKQSGAGLKA
jgi:hypothetical protein